MAETWITREATLTTEGFDVWTTADNITNVDADNDQHKTWHKIVTALNISKGVFGTAAILANLFTLACFIKYGFTKKKMNVFLFNLCISDLLGGLVAVWIFFTNYLPLFSDGLPKQPCLATGLVVLMSFGSSLFSMSGATIESYIMIGHPMTHVQYADSRVHFLCGALMWVLCVILSGLSLVGNEYQAGSQSCIVKNFTGPVQGVYIWLPVVLTQLALIGILYIRILRIASKQRRAIAAQIVVVNIAPNVKDEQVATGRRTSLVIALITVLYITWLPYVSIIVYRKLATAEMLRHPATAIYDTLCDLALLLTGVLNPFMYQRFSPDIKRAYALCVTGVQPSQP